MGIFSKMFSRTPEQIVNRSSAKKLETLARSSDDRTVRYLAAKRLDREEVWQYMALHDPDNFFDAMENCRDLQFLERLMDQHPDEKYPIQSRMGKVASSVMQKKIAACSDQEKLLAWIMNDETDIPEYRYLYHQPVKELKDQALEKITDQEVLFQIASDRDDETALGATRCISDPDLLVRIALAPEKDRSGKRSAALSGLHDTDRLQYIAEHAADSGIVRLTEKRLREEKSLQLCANGHQWDYLREETDDDGDSPRFDYIYEKCTRCGTIRCNTYIVGRLISSEIDYDLSK